MKDFKSELIVGILVGVIVTFLGWIISIPFKRKKEKLDKNRPILLELRKLLIEIEQEVRSFADKGTTKILGSHITINNGNKVLANVNNCGGAFSWVRILSAIQKIENFLSEKFLPDIYLNREKEELIKIKELLEKLHNNLKDFNKRWPANHSIEMLEKKNGTQLFEDVIPKLSDFIAATLRLRNFRSHIE